MKISTIHLDMDGVIANFDGYIKQVTGKTCDELNAGCSMAAHTNDDRTDPVFRVMKEHINEHDMFFQLEPFDIEEWIEIVSVVRSRGFRVELLSAAPSDGLLAKSREQKIRWAAKHNLEVDDIIILPSASLKKKYARHTTLLIDDYEKNVRGYANAGGLVIHHKNLPETKSRLEFYTGKI
jgi:hypothetical protein